MIDGTLAKIEAIKASRPTLSDAQIEREAAVPQGWLAKTRLGRNRHPSAMVSLEAMVRWGTANEVKAPGRSVNPNAAMGGCLGLPGSPEAKGAFSALAQQIREIGTSAKRHREAVQGFAVAMLEDPTFDPKRSELALNALKEMKHSIKLEKVEVAQERLADLELMTADEVDAFVEFLKLRTPKGLVSGEAAKAPGQAASAT